MFLGSLESNFGGPIQYVEHASARGFGSRDGCNGRIRPRRFKKTYASDSLLGLLFTPSRKSMPALFRHALYSGIWKSVLGRCFPFRYSDPRLPSLPKFSASRERAGAPNLPPTTTKSGVKDSPATRRGRPAHGLGRNARGRRRERRGQHICCANRCSNVIRLYNLKREDYSN